VRIVGSPRYLTLLFYHLLAQFARSVGISSFSPSRQHDVCSIYRRLFQQARRRRYGWFSSRSLSSDFSTLVAHSCRLAVPVSPHVPCQGPSQISYVLCLLRSWKIDVTGVLAVWPRYEVRRSSGTSACEVSVELSAVSALVASFVQRS